jgi:AmmeMemoRadiSam system protein A
MLEERAGVFVSIKKDGELRGCIGTTTPTRENIAEEILSNSVSAAVRDPRFEPITEGELDSLTYSVDVLAAPEPISSPDELDVKRYGVIVSSGGRRGLLLPDLAGVDTPEQQIDIARRKGGIGEREPYGLERFEVIRHK